MQNVEFFFSIQCHGCHIVYTSKTENTATTESFKLQKYNTLTYPIHSSVTVSITKLN
jgi:hypothetical protein